MDLFRIRLNCVDHYQAHPTQFDPRLRNNEATSQRPNEPEVPIILVFGSTETGQKVCAHIHGVFPYLYVEYTGSLSPDQVGEYMQLLHISIDRALAVSYRRKDQDGQNKFVARITLVKGIPFYGYYVGYRYYLKIYMLNPLAMTRLSDMLRQGVIMKTIFQPYEAHLQYILQWMIDYNLYGCGYIDCRKAFFREPVPRYNDVENLAHLWHDKSIPKEYMVGDVLPRASHCSIEVDICAQDILNRLEIKPRQLHHDFIERLNPLPLDERLVHSMAGLWRDETRRRKSKMIDPDPGSSPFPPEVMIPMSADPRNSQRGGWIHEKKYIDKIQSLISEEKREGGNTKPSFDTFVKKTPFDSSIKTTLEAVEDLYPENLEPNTYDEPESIENKETEVDETRISNLDNEDGYELMYDSDEEIVRQIRLSKRGDECHAEKLQRSIYHTNKHSYEKKPTVKTENPTNPTNPTYIPDSSEFVDDGVALGTIIRGAPDSNKKESSHSPVLGSNSSIPTISSLTPTVVNNSPPTSSLEKGASKRSKPHSHIENKHNKCQRTHLADVDTGECTLLKPHKNNNTLENRICGREQKGPIDWPEEREGRLEILPPLTVTSTAQKLAPAEKCGEETSGSYDATARQPISSPDVKDPHDSSAIIRLSQDHAFQKSLGVKERKNLFSRPSLVSQNILKSSLLCDPSAPIGILNPSIMISEVLSSIIKEFRVSGGCNLLAFTELPPTRLEVSSSMQDFGLPPAIYQDAYYSDEADVPGRVREWAGRDFKLGSLTVPFLPDFDLFGTSAAAFGEKPTITYDRIRNEANFQRWQRNCGLRGWEIGNPPPSSAEVIDWLQSGNNHMPPSIGASMIRSSHTGSLDMKAKLSQIEGPTQRNKHGFKYTQRRKTTNVQHETQYMSTMSLEVHVNTRDNFIPDPEEDAVHCVFWRLESNKDEPKNNIITGETRVGIVVLSEVGSMKQKIARQVAVEVQEETSELDLLVRVVEIVRNSDPDILTGYEIHNSSWGYLIERARLRYGLELCYEFSRMKLQSGRRETEWASKTTSKFQVTGRHMINIWRAMRKELNLLQYTLENVVFHLLHRRIPHYAWRDLTLWYRSGKPGDLAKVLNYYVSRVQLDLEILEQNELIYRTSEQARLLGVDFFSVFSRGSQFNVESLMFRISKPENFLLISPSKKQVGEQNALECLPLVMEPQSAFYTSPMLVLDFQSLYPSVMIAYNYCYSTFLGRVGNWRGINKMGFTEYKRKQGILELLEDQINIAPNGIMYVKPGIRKSLLGKMLGEILETRVMVKSGMKIDESDKTLQMLLNNRQLALKLIANVTYGYTSASFSGRMPCSEIADSIVQTGRETLEKAIALIHSNRKWDAEVVYGDTDSLFVYLKGRTKDQAFQIGKEIADEVTRANPRPVKLKFEKVYFPCLLLAKKRYVGFKYEKGDQEEPEFDAKGIETVRRDGTPAEQKIEEQALKVLFRSSDLSQVKSYFQEQCRKIMKGSISIHDFCFAKEVKLGSYNERGILPPGAIISTRRMRQDHRSEPQYGERVPYVVTAGAPGARLIDRCVSPETLLYSEHKELDAEYYISKNIIPALERIFNLVGANVRGWYEEMPKVQRIRKTDPGIRFPEDSKDPAISKKTLESYMRSSSCLVCKEKLESESPICVNCLKNQSRSLLALQTRLGVAEKKFLGSEEICRSCSGSVWLDEVKCDSKDCPVFYTRARQKAKLKTEQAIIGPVMKILQDNELNMAELEW